MNPLIEVTVHIPVSVEAALVALTVYLLERRRAREKGEDDTSSPNPP